MGMIPLIRTVVLGTTTLFSLIVLGLAAHLVSVIPQYTFSALALVVALLSLLTLPAMFIIDMSRNGAFTSMIVVEVAWLFILTILWVAAAGLSASTSAAFTLFGGCGTAVVGSFIAGVCQETQAVEAFAFLNFIITLVYAVFLTIMSVMAATRGQGIWLSSVKESFGSSTGPPQYPMTQHNTPAQPKAYHNNDQREPGSIAV